MQYASMHSNKWVMGNVNTHPTPSSQFDLGLDYHLVGSDRPVVSAPNMHCKHFLASAANTQFPSPSLVKLY